MTKEKSLWYSQRRNNAAKLLLVLIVLVLLPFAAAQAGDARKSHSGPQVKDGVFHSAALARDMHYRVLLPADYASGGRFPVLYLLHGLYGDYKNWDTLTHLEDYARHLRFIIVMPDAGDSWYANSATVAADKFNDYVAKDLISEIDGQFRTIRDRHARAIAGLSMGGYGSIKFSLQHPELFIFAGSLSGALNAAQNLDTLRPEFRAKILEVFGNEGSEVRRQDDVFRLISSARPDSAAYFYLACGTSDFFVATNRSFVQQLSEKKVAYEYHETAGGHAWDYWDRELEPLLVAVNRAFGGAAGPREVESHRGKRR